MSGKQVTWRCSKAILSVLLLVSSTSSFSMSGSKGQECTSQSEVEALIDSILQERLKTHQTEMLQSERSTDYFKDYAQDQLDEAYEQAPVGVKTLLKRLQHPEIKLADPDIRAAFFYGVPGTGKTRTGIMLAYKLGWAYIKKRATRLTEKNRGGATVNLRQLLDSMVAPEPGGTVVPTIGILDEVEESLEHAGDSHYDTASTSRELGGFLEDQRNNENFFLVSTLNKCETFQELMKSRMKGKRFIFETIIDPQEKVLAFIRKLCTDKIIMEQCSKRFLLDTVGQLKECSGRDLRSLANLTLDKAFEDSDLQGYIEIKPKHVQEAVSQIKKDSKDLCCGKEEITEFKQRELHHRESIKTNLLSQTRQKSQVTGGINGGINGGGGSLGGNLGGSLSKTSSPGMSKKDAEKTWNEVFPNSDEKLFEEDKQKDGEERDNRSREKNGEASGFGVAEMVITVAVCAASAACNIQ